LVEATSFVATGIQFGTGAIVTLVAAEIQVKSVVLLAVQLYVPGRSDVKLVLA
jgi:hypothetical protein